MILDIFCGSDIFFRNKKYKGKERSLLMTVSSELNEEDGIVADTKVEKVKCEEVKENAPCFTHEDVEKLYSGEMTVSEKMQFARKIARCRKCADRYERIMETAHLIEG